MRQETELFREATDLSALSLRRIHDPEFGKRLVDALEPMADRDNHDARRISTSTPVS